MVNNYALISSSVVANIVRIEEEDVEEYVAASGYDAAIAYDPQVTQVYIGDGYSNGQFSRTLPPIMSAKAQKLTDFKAAIQDFMDLAYDSNTRQQLMNIYLLSKFGSLTNRAAYLEQLLTWINSIITYSQVFMNTVRNMNSVENVLAASWDIQSNISADPKITVGGAISILD